MPITPIWNWQQESWPDFRYQPEKLARLEADFLRHSGVFSGALKHISADDQALLTVDLIGEEAMTTSEIEGEILDRASLQSSIRRNFGLATDHRRVPPAEQGIAQMMVELYRHFDDVLSNELLCRWHALLMNGRQDLAEVGAYRTGKSPMQVVSGSIYEPQVHFEAPPSMAVPKEMNRFIRWFNTTAPPGTAPLPILARAGIAHLWFVSIHPFEDGNGRIGRAIAEKVLSQGLGTATLVALSSAINRRRKIYYEMLERSNKGMDVTAWLIYFAETALVAQRHTQETVDFIIAKMKFFDQLRGQLNPRQEKVVLRMFREGPGGFQGGLSAEKYIRLTTTSRATATRDLQDLVDKNALTRTGALKSTRYHLRLKAEPAVLGSQSSDNPGRSTR